jgi:hypothetical protein
MKQANESLIIRAIRRVRVLRYLSFTHGRFSRQRVARYLPELQQINKEFRHRSTQKWAESMAAHNAILFRGRYMHLLPIDRMEWLLFTSLDRYILQMHAKVIADVLNGLSKFAERVLPKIHQDRAARTWKICNQVLIQRRHWFSFTHDVMNFLNLLGFGDARMNGPLSPWLSPWPDFDFLAEEARRTTKYYSIFGTADIDEACI